MFNFHKTYFLLSIMLFTIEVLIATYVHDNIIRPYVGDFLVVILLYCFVKSFFNMTPITTAIGILLFSYFIEILQYLHIVNLLGLQHSKLATTIIGNYFTWVDILAYTLGIVLVILIESFGKTNKYLNTIRNA